MVIKQILHKLVTVALLLVLTLTLAACGGGSSSSSGSKNNCVSITDASGGVNVKNSCDFKINVAFFDPLFRFSLEKNETKFLARTTAINFGACKASAKPKEISDSRFICD